MSKSTVLDIYDQHLLGALTREEMIAAISEIEDYQPGVFEGYDGYTPGSADGIVGLMMEEKLEVSEMTRIVTRWDERGLK